MTSKNGDITPARVRFAPSPTGLFHIGGARTALFDYLWAKRTGGKFILRIEDTDQSRYSEEALDSLYNGLRWLGLTWDEGPEVGGSFGPYVQSQRLDIYSEHVEKLLTQAKAYRCFCTPERLKDLRERGLKGYDRHCRDLASEVVETKVDAKEKNVVRFRTPMEGVTTGIDTVRGEVTMKNPLIDDFVILKSDGFPTYHLASVVDDHLMEISHVLRGEEWISSLSRHVLLYKAFGWEPPIFVHVPVILGTDGKKLSKRHGAMAVTEYREAGFMPDAVVNFLSLMGWSPGDDREYMPREELIDAFSIDRILAKPAIFDDQKLEWLNGQYMSALSAEELFETACDEWIKAGLIDRDACEEKREWLLKVIDLGKTRLKRTSDFAGFVGYFLVDPSEYDPKVVKKRWKEQLTAPLVSELADAYDKLQTFSVVSTEECLRAVTDGHEAFAGSLIHPVRLAVSGIGVGPSLFDMLEVLGRETVVRRLRIAVSVLG